MAEGEQSTIKIIFTDRSEKYTRTMGNSVVCHRDKPTAPADVNLILSKLVLNQILPGNLDLEQAVDQNLIAISGDESLCWDCSTSLTCGSVS